MAGRGTWSEAEGKVGGAKIYKRIRGVCGLLLRGHMGL